DPPNVANEPRTASSQRSFGSIRMLGAGVGLAFASNRYCMKVSQSATVKSALHDGSGRLFGLNHTAVMPAAFAPTLTVSSRSPMNQMSLGGIPSLAAAISNRSAFGFRTA